MPIKSTDTITGRLTIREAMGFDFNSLSFSPSFWQLDQQVTRSGREIDISLSEHRTVDSAKQAAEDLYGPIIWEKLHGSIYRAQVPITTVK